LIDETLAVIASIVVGIAGGFLSSWMAFNASGETFSGRKHGNALIIGALSGLALGVTMVVADPTNMTTGQFVIALVLIFLAAVGIDRLRSSGADMVANSTPSRTITSPHA
jgi:energy-converting hydrogenase Eha subunit B